VLNFREDADRRKSFLNQVPLADYTFDTTQPDKLESEICREQGTQGRKYPFQDRPSVLTCRCLQLKISSKQLFDQMQKSIDRKRRKLTAVNYFCALPQNPGTTDLRCRKVVL
jgi:hypothetical protein